MDACLGCCRNNVFVISVGMAFHVEEYMESTIPLLGNIEQIKPVLSL